MLLDWFTIAAQIVNFLILLFLLRRFLYRPILNTMEAREQRIAGILAEAEQKRKEAEKERLHYDAKNEEWRANFDERQRDMEVSLENWRKDALQDARQNVDRTLEGWLKTVEDHKADFLADLNQFAVRQTYTVARRAVEDLAGTELETLMIHAFLENLKRQEIDLRQLADHSGQAQGTTLKLRSAFELPSTLHQQLQTHLRDQLNHPVDFEVETAPDLIAGIEVVGNRGYTAAWNLQRYLETLQNELDNEINAHLGERSLLPSQAHVEAEDGQ